MRIFYGISLIIGKSIDVTDICLSKLTKNNVIDIPATDFIRASYFTDPFFGILKSVFIVMDDTVHEINEHTQLLINTITHEMSYINQNSINEKLQNVHSKLNITHGDLMDELPEQKMAVRYLTGNEKVLEIGGNIGRNSLVIASILQEASNLVTLETSPDIANQLKENRDLNNLNFHIENSALSNRKLIQIGWDTIPSEVLLPGYQWVNTTGLNELKSKYNIEFDTLVLDCEGAFYYILMDMPDILNTVNLIIMENDYHDISQKECVDKILTEHNFHRHYVEGGGWGPCYHNFFEVWKKYSN
jgi:FkbM family methyltransferase